MAYKYDIGNITEIGGSYSVRFGNYNDDNFVSKFFAKTKYDNPKKAAETFHKKIVDSGWSSLKGMKQDSPLRDAIRKAYKEIGKGKNTTTDDIYQKIKNIDYVDLSDVRDTEFTDKQFSDLEKGRFILWKTGGLNPYMEDLGKIFPYVQDTVQKIIKTIRVKIGSEYPRFHLEYWKNNKRYFYEIFR